MKLIMIIYLTEAAVVWKLEKKGVVIIWNYFKVHYSVRLLYILKYTHIDT